MREPDEGERLHDEPAIRALESEERDPEHDEDVHEQHALTIGEELDDQVHKPSGNDDGVLHLFAVEVSGDARKLLGARDELVVVKAGRHLDPAAHAAVHLDDELEGLALEESGIGLGPLRAPEPLVAEALPKLLGDVRHVRLDEADRGLRREADRGRLIRDRPLPRRCR